MPDQNNLALFRELITCGDELYSWQYNDQLVLLDSNCPQKELLDTIFRRCEFQPRLLTQARASSVPLMLSISLGLVWVAVFEKSEGLLSKIHVIGPAFSALVSPEKLAVELGESYPAEASLAYKQELVRILEELPVISSMVLTRYALMLHYCVNGDKLAASDIGISLSHGFTEPRSEESDNKPRSLWMLEEELLNRIRTGDLQFGKILNSANILQNRFSMKFQDTLRQGKTMAAIFVSLCMRAAIEGGLPPEQAYAIRGVYLQSIEDCRSLADIEVLDNTMYRDFVRRVYKVRQQGARTKQIRACCEYIHFHVNEKLRLEDLAAHVGYSPYYLSRKFRTEVGVSINEYIKAAKIEQAKILLAATDETIANIVEQLNFSSRSFFVDSFISVTGTSPAKYREEAQRF